MLDELPGLDVHTIRDIRSKAERGRRMQDSQSRNDVAMIATRAFERLAFALFTPLRAEQARPIADEYVPVNDAPFAVVQQRRRETVAPSSSPRIRIPSLAPYDQKLRNSRPRTYESQQAICTRTLVTFLRKTAWR